MTVNPGETIKVTYEHHWENHPSHWESEPTKTFEVSKVRYNDSLELVDEKGEEYVLHNDGELFVVAEKEPRRTCTTGVNAEIIQQ